MANYPKVTVPGMLAWARQMPAEEEYNFLDTRGCALFQYCKHLGLPVSSVGVTSWSEDNPDATSHKVDQSFEIAGAVVDEPRTFGALADRLANAQR